MEVERLLQVAVVAGDSTHRVLKSIEVGESHAELCSRYDLQRAHRIVGAERDVVRLSHVGDLAHFGDASSQADIGHKVIPNYGVRNVRYKLIFYYGVMLEDTHNPEINIEAEWELYDLEADPREMNNVYAQPEFAEVQAVMLTELDRLQAKAGDAPRH